MVDQDFFLRFGSNAEDFARDVKQEISGARRELGLLSKEIQKVNRASQGSATAKLVSGIRADIKSAMSDVAKTIGQELRSALRGELKNLNLGDITVTGTPRGGGGESGRVSSREVSDADKQAARLKRAAEQSAKVAEDAYTQAAREVETILEGASRTFESVKAASQELQGDARIALSALSIALNEMKRGADAARAEERKLRANAKRNQPGVARDVNLQKAGEAGVAATGLEARFGKLQNALDELRGGSLDAEGAIKRAVSALEQIGLEKRATDVERLGAGRAERARPGQPEVRGEAFDAAEFIRAANLQARAANDLQAAVDQFQTHVQSFKTASQNIKITGIEGLTQAQAQSRGRPQGERKTLEDVESEISGELDATVAVAHRNAEAVEKATKAAENEAKARDEAAKAVRGNANRTLELMNQIPRGGLEQERELVRSRGLRLPDFSRLQSAMLWSGEAATGGPLSARPFSHPITGETKTRQAAREERAPGARVDIDEEAVRAEIEALRTLQDLLRAEIDRVETRVGREEDVQEGREEISGLQQEIERLGQAAVAIEDRLTGDPEVRREAEALAQVTQANRQQATAIGNAIEAAVADGLNLQQVETLLSEFPSQIRKAFGERLAIIDQMAAQGAGLPGGMDSDEARLAAQARDAEREARELRAQTQQRAAREAAESVGRLGDLGIDTQTISQITKLTGAIPLRGRDIEGQLQQAQAIVSRMGEMREQMTGPGAEEARAEVDRLMKVAANRIETLTRQLNTGVADDRLLRIPRPTTQRPVVSDPRRRALREQLGREGVPQATKVAGEIADVFERTARQAFDVQSKLLQQEDARQTLEAVEAGRAAGDVDPERLDKAEQGATRALNRIEKEFEEFGGPLARFQQLIGELSSASVGRQLGLGEILQGRSMRELVMESAAPQAFTPMEEGLGREELLARERATAEIAREKGLSGTKFSDLEEALDPQEMQAARARIKEEVAQSVTNFKRQEEAADRAREAGERFAPVLERIAGLMSASADVDVNLIRRRIEEEGLRGPTGRQADLRSFMEGGGDPRRVVDALGGLDAAIRSATQIQTGGTRPPEFNVERAKAEFEELRSVRGRIGVMESIETPMDPQQHERRLQGLQKAEENLIQKINERARNVGIANEKRKEFDRQAERIAAQVREGDLSALRPVAEGRIETLRSPEQRALRLRAIGQEAGLTEGQVAGVTTAQELLNLVAAMKENTAATRAEQASTEQNTVATKQLEASTKEASIVARQRISALSIGDQASVATFLAGGRVPAEAAERRPLEQLGVRAGQFRGSTLDDIFAKATEQVGLSGRKVSTRGVLEGLTGEEAPDTLTQDFVDKARLAAEDLRAAAAQQRGVLDEIQARSEGAQDERLINVLNELSGAIKRLSECCAAMQSAVRGGGFGAGLSRDKEIARMRGTQGAERLIGANLQKEITNSLRQAVAATTPEARRKALGQAALAAKGDPSLGLDDATVVGVIQRLFSGIQASQRPEGFIGPTRDIPGAGQGALSNEDVAAIQGGLLQLQRVLEVGGQEAAEAFKSGDIRAAAEAMQTETRDVERTLQTLRNAFDVTEDDIKALRPALERFEQGLVTAAVRPGDEGFIGPVRPTQGQVNEDQLRRARADELAGQTVDLDDQSPEAAMRTAQAALNNVNQEMVDHTRFLSEMQRLYPNLNAEEQTRLRGMVEARNEAIQAAQANDAYARSLAQVLPQAEGQRFLGAVGSASDPQAAGRMVDDFVGTFEKATGQGASQTLRGAMSKLFQGIDLDPAGRNAVDKFARAGLTQLQTYRTPFQHVISSLFRGQGIVQATLSQAGFAISRFLGGSIIFGAVNQMQELGRIALETEQTFIRVEEALAATGRASDGLRTKLQDIAVDTNVQLGDTVEVMAQLVGVFETTEEALTATKIVNQLELISQGALNAREGFRSLSAVASTFQETLTAPVAEGGRGFTDVEAIEYIADLTVRLQDLTGVNIEDTIEGLGRLGEQANSLNISMELLASTIGLASKATGQTGQATSEQIGRILSNFQKPEVQNLLVDLGITDRATVQARDFGQVLEDLLGGYDDLTRAQQRSVAGAIGDPRQAAVTEAVLRRGAEALDIYEQSFENAGAAAERTEKVLSTIRGQVGLLGKQIQTFVQNLVDLGILTLLGVALKVAIEFLGVVNNILQVFTNISEISPLTKFITQIGLATASFLVLRTMIKGAVDEFLRMNAAQAGMSGATLGTQFFASMRNARQGQRVAGGGGLQFDWETAGSTAPAAPVRRPSILQRSPLARGARDLSGIDDVSRPLGHAAAQVKESVGSVTESFKNMRPKLTKFRTGLQRMGPELIGGAIAIGLLVDLITRAGRDAKKFYADLANTSAERQSTDESEEEALARTRREEVDATVAAIASVDTLADRIKNLGEVINFVTSGGGFGGLENYFTLQKGFNPFLAMLQPDLGAGARDQFGDALAGQSDEADALVDEAMATMAEAGRLAARGDTEGALENVRGIRENTLSELETMIDEAPTAAVAATLQQYYETLEETTSETTAALIAQQQDFEHEVDLDTRQIEQFLSAVEGISAFESMDLARYREDIQNAFIDGFVPVGSEEEIAGMLSSGDFQSRMDARSRAVDFALDQARLELEQVDDPDEQEAAREQLQKILQMRAELDQELLAQAVDIPASFAEIALRRGDYARAEGLLSQALNAVREQRRQAAPGSPQEAEAIQREFELLRQQAEAQIEEQVGVLELAAIGLDDPIESVGNQLEVLQLRLQSAYDNPGAYTPEEIRGFIKEVADLQEQIADEQEKIADAYDEYLASTANNEIARTAIEYQSALRRYRRALESDAGAAAITQAATEVNEAARAQREAAEALREARVQAQIARIPEGDSLSRSLAELREAYRRQAAIIEEFGRNSTEFHETISDIIDAQRSAEQAAREAADSVLDLAISLAKAAGLDIRGARLSVQQAEAEVQRAIRDSGGRTDTAAVRQALAGLVDAQAQLRDTVLGEALETVDFMLNMEEITEQQAIQVLQQILDTADLTEDQRRDLMTRIKGLKDAINDGVNEQFNLGDIRIPTPFEVRRALKVEEITQGIQDSVDAVTELDAPTLPGDRIGPAPEGLLESILGPDIASEVMGLGATGGNISEEIRNLGRGLSGDLLPPLSQIPQIIDAQLSTRDEMIARSDMEIQTLIANNEALNASVNQVGPTIAAPLAAIHEAEIAALELEAHTNIMLEDANNYLSNLASLTKDLRDDFRYWANNMMSEQGMKAWGERYQAQADAGYRPPSRDESNNVAAQYVQHVNNTFTIDGTDTGKVEKIIFDTVGTNAIGRESVSTTIRRI